MDKPISHKFQVNRGNEIKAYVRGFNSMPDKTKEAILRMVEHTYCQLKKQSKTEVIRG